MTTMLQDLRYGLRMLWKTPVVSGVAALSLALGIAANTSTLSLVSGFLLEPLPYADQDGLVVLREGREGLSIEAYPGVSMGNLRDYAAGSRGIAAAAAYSVTQVNLTGVDQPEQLAVVEATPNLFEVLGVSPVLGRAFREEEGAEGLGQVAVLTHDFWTRRFQGERDVLGRTLTMDGTTYSVVGVMPEEFDVLPANVDLYRPTDFASQWENRATRGYIAYARLASGATAETVQREVDAVFAGIQAEFPDGNRGWRAAVTPARKYFPGPTDTKLVLILSAVTLFGLLIACANVANLLLGRAEERQKEVAVRTALGAGRMRILRQLLTESVALGVVSGTLGLGLSVYVIDWLRAAMPPMIPRVLRPELDPTVVAATIAVSVLTGVAFGLLPALHASRGDLREALGEGSRGGTAGRSRKRMRNAFVIGEFAVALALLSGASYLTTAFDAVVDAEPGYRQDGLLTFALTASDRAYPEDTDVVVYQDELVSALAAVPGVTGVATMSSLPRSMFSTGTRYGVSGRDTPEDERPRAGLQAVNPAYFSTLEIPLVAGRGFTETDRMDAERVAVVTRALVRREFDGEDALGRVLDFRGASWTIVGVAEDVLLDRVALAGDGGEAIFVPAMQLPQRVASVAVRTAGDPTRLAGDLRRAVWGVDPDQPLAGVRTLDEHVAESLAGPKAIALFVTTMGVIALLLAAIGIYGVMAHAVTQQQREIGIRMALGAGRGSVVGMVARSGLSLAGLGMLVGLPLSWLMYRAVSSALNLFEGTVGASAAVGVAVALGAVAALATWLPAARASGVQPVVALKE